jgi:DNA polymerase-3 subunit alpha
MKNYVAYHLHSDLSITDSATKFYKYLDRAKEYCMKALAFSEHGNVFNWIKKKEDTEKRDMKYIHAMEAYVTERIDEKQRDNYHMMFIAKNYDGVKEINKMSSKAFVKTDGHFYFDARFSLEEVMNTSDNIMITTSCLGGLLSKGRRLGKHDLINQFIEWALKNKHRVFFEIQYHNYPEQIEYNHYLYELHKNFGVQLIAGTDTHALDAKYARARRILMQAKGIKFQDEDLFDLTFKSYDELVFMFQKQNHTNASDFGVSIGAAPNQYDLGEWKLAHTDMYLSEEVFLAAIEFTNTMADMVEAFTLDKSPKYPKLYDNPEQVFKDKINAGIKKRGIHRKHKKNRKLYYDTITEEFEVYKKLNSIDYMLFQEDVITDAHKRGIFQGYGRGSVNGSLIAYCLGITEMDSIRYKLNFFRFMNPERISLADIDCDFPPSRRQEVIDYVASKPNVYFSEIITFNTVALKGAVREVGRALKYDLDIVDEIAKNVEDNATTYRNQYPELFEYVDLLNGVNVSVGSHPSGFVVSPIPLDENIGLFYTANSKYPVSQVNMKELESNFYVKLDILGLLNIELINITCELAGIERLVPDNLDVNDIDVWASMGESTLGIFQWESDSAFAYYKELFKEETLRRIKEQNPNISYIDLFSIGNGAIRPSGDSYRNALADGIFKDNGHEALNEFLKDTVGYLVYQEQIMNWLVEFCGYSGKESDSVRRSISKKDSDDFPEILAEITERFVATMLEKFNTSKDDAVNILTSLLKVIDDAQRYGFSVNHSTPYSLIGYANAYLRHYYPLEFLTALLNLNEDKKDKTAKIVEYAQTRDISIRSIKFGKSRASYSFSREEKTIFKGLKSIKYLNERIADELYELGQVKYITFVDLLINIKERTSVDTRQLNVLIRLNFFSEFGKIGKLLAIVEEFASGKNRYNKSHKQGTKEKRIPLLREFEKDCEPKKIEMYDLVMFEKEHLGYIETTFPKLDPAYAIITSIDTKYKPKVYVYVFKTGQELMYKVEKKYFYDRFGFDTLLVGDIIKIDNVAYKNKMRFEGGKFIELPALEPYIESCSLVERPKGVGEYEINEVEQVEEGYYQTYYGG